jgi:hypothetical protein
MLNLFQHLTGQTACLVYTLHTRLHGVYFAHEVPKRVRHDILFNFKTFMA